MIIGILVIAPYIWYVFNLLSKWESVTINIPRTLGINYNNKKDTFKSVFFIWLG